MPVIISAKKKLRADKSKQKVNRKVIILVKNAIKNLRSSPSKETLSKAYSALDTAAKKRVTPKKRVDRKKSRLAMFLSKNPKATRADSKKIPKKSIKRKLSSQG